MLPVAPPPAVHDDRKYMAQCSCVACLSAEYQGEDGYWVEDEEDEEGNEGFGEGIFSKFTMHLPSSGQILKSGKRKGRSFITITETLSKPGKHLTQGECSTT